MLSLHAHSPELGALGALGAFGLALGLETKLQLPPPPLRPRPLPLPKANLEGRFPHSAAALRVQAHSVPDFMIWLYVWLRANQKQFAILKS